MSTQQQTAPSGDFDKNIFYVLLNDGSENVVIANNEDEITTAKLVISLEEVERIRDRLISTRLAVENVSSISIATSVNSIEEVSP